MTRWNFPRRSIRVWKVGDLDAGGLTSNFAPKNEQTHFIREDTRELVRVLDALSPEAVRIVREKVLKDEGVSVDDYDSVYNAQWIYGPPGSGKSTTVYGWARSKSMKQKVLWVHFEDRIRMVRFFEGKSEIADIDSDQWRSIYCLVKDRDIVVLDGGGKI